MAAATTPKKRVQVLDQQMAYVEMGSGDPIVFQHGNPTSSYLWRNILPKLANYGRCIAIDLIGMGDSEKLSDSGPERYTFGEQASFFEAALAALDIKNNVVLVLHDWGSALGFDWARRHESVLKGICYMEAIVRPLTWNEWPEASRSIFQGFRSSAGEEMILDKNLFVERVLPGSVMRKMTDEEMSVYREPYLQSGEDRRPMLTWPRQIPIDGEPDSVVRIVRDYADWLESSDVPKLFINAEPGAILIGDQREFCRSWSNQTEVTVRGSHFIQEDSPEDISKAIQDWLSVLPRS